MKKSQKRISNVSEIKAQLKTVETKVHNGVFLFSGIMTIAELAQKINVSVNQIITYFFHQAKMYNLNHSLSEDEIAEICLEFGLDFKKEVQIDASNFMEEVSILDQDKDLSPRPPIITVMGHVDHGKTTLLDYIRKTNIAKNEKGGITQHTGAYQVVFQGHIINFIDTPGHEAFTQMRARGAKVTDIIVLVVAADDGVMPQTKEAINHAAAANVPIIVFVNKMDKPNKDVDRIKNELSALNIVTEEWGGSNIFVYGSALTGQGIDTLFSSILLLAEILELKANKNRYPIGTVIEAKLHHNKGTIATLMVQNGTLMVRDFIVAGYQYGRIRSLENTNGQPIKFAPPGTPVIVTGLNYVPEAGDKFFGFHEEKFAKQLALEKKQSEKISKTKVQTKQQTKEKTLNIIIKADVAGIAQALHSTIEKLASKQVHIHILHSGVGIVNKADILLAQTSNSIIYAFNLQIPAAIKAQAKQAQVEIREHTIIYKIVDEIKKQVRGMREIRYELQQIGTAKIIAKFWFSKVGSIAGCSVLSGRFVENCKIELWRNSKLIHSGKIESLQRDKNPVKEVQVGNEFGTHIYKFNDIEIGDELKAFLDVEIEE
ncbi:translation initiation factor IF-2 [Mesomycoplasma hyopneumoniae]|uniref:Translation initiation factor IF-2 n=2 Tax=Mesomycoplasma hyopneumoniae (strain 168) TaxID=907287 RepID=E4QTP0_MESH1|nr:translation initiation factor IF-2 [Mesomycoplasma hyopneumoniae]ADQ90785.1 Translation initiation factor IF-2 [Mesomycoplasma hyopneumoniae 168]AGM22359.1 Translation initiation factor IF-2 [Mesomycoplasma hyopneumoniae 168-L]OWY73996.1 translation initiation factor IF-2 [Mesomycoplasma hyopneumoniae]